MKRKEKDSIQFRIRRSDATIKEAKALAEIKQWNGLGNRLYYASFYAVSALLFKKEVLQKLIVV